MYIRYTLGRYFINYFINDILTNSRQDDANCAANSNGEKRNSFKFKNIKFSAQSSTVITVNQGVRGGKVIELKKTVDEAVSSCPMVQQVFVAMRTEKPVELTARDVAMEEVRDQNVLINITFDSRGWGLYMSRGKIRGLIRGKKDKVIKQIATIYDQQSV